MTSEHVSMYQPTKALVCYLRVAFMSP